MSDIMDKLGAEHEKGEYAKGFDVGFEAGRASALVEVVPHLTRIEILVGRIRGCHEETGKHELIDEAECFASEARALLARIKERPGPQGENE